MINSTFNNDEYYKSITEYILHHDEEKNVFIYPPTNNISEVLSEADVGVLSSKSEGLPLVLLEYGLAKLPVVSTDVGQCKDVISNHGILVEKENPEKLSEALKMYIDNSEYRMKMSKSYHKHIIENYSKERYHKELIKLYFELFK